jgi:RNA-directed DNA polymerase
MSLATPITIRTLQRKLSRKAKAEPAFRFYVLYDKIYREDILRHGYALARANAGAPGTDGITFAAIEASGLDSWLAGLREELISKTYRPDPVRRVTIPKPDGGERPLGIPTIRDRVVQAAAKLVLEPIFEADFEDSAYGYRPAGRSAQTTNSSGSGGRCNSGRGIDPRFTPPASWGAARIIETPG